MRTEYLYGANTVSEVLKSDKRKIIKLLVSKHSPVGKAKIVISTARKKGIKVTFCEPRLMDRIAKAGNHQGVILEVAPLKPMAMVDALGSVQDKKKLIWAAIDGITDPMNLGPIIRSAACFGVSALILPERRTVGITPIVQKTASGALEKIKIVRAVNLNQAIIDLKKKGFWVYGADMEGTPAHKATFAYPALIIIGSEGQGLHKQTRKHCDEIVSIPQKGGVESLNASVAAGIIFYEMTQKRGK
ncbi:MAG: 23S rRNA (guanosine(2251)-2'-O)-methyltransferase RlmB [Elusimicrobiota bacterium]|nr:23S rRNA (guanosine(2251)-2'-O)-methyltransferase RlmB [Elusimicrobiota bacterium]